jgi:hypothetical protein
MAEIPDHQVAEVNSWIRNASQRLSDLDRAQAEARERHETAVRANQARMNNAAGRVGDRGMAEYGHEKWQGTLQTLSRDAELSLDGVANLVSVAAPMTGHHFIADLAADDTLRSRFKSVSDESRVEMVRQHARNRSAYGVIEPDREEADTIAGRAAEAWRNTPSDAQFSREFDKHFGTGRRR